MATIINGFHMNSFHSITLYTARLKRSRLFNFVIIERKSRYEIHFFHANVHVIMWITWNLDDRRGRKFLDWKPPYEATVLTRSVGRPPTHWTDALKRIALDEDGRRPTLAALYRRSPAVDLPGLMINNEVPSCNANERMRFHSITLYTANLSMSPGVGMDPRYGGARVAAAACGRRPGGHQAATGRAATAG